MKSIYKIGFLVCLGAILSSCSFLDTDPHAVVDKGNYYTSTAKLDNGLTGIYGVMGAYEFYGGQYSVLVSGTDDLCYYNNYNDASSRVERYNYTASTDEIYQVWAKIYEGVKNANEFMRSLEHPDFDKQALDPHGYYYNQARFLRAYYHFLLAQAWGDVPLRVEPVASPNPEHMKLAATPQARVLQWCTEQMEAAIGTDELPGLETRSTKAPSTLIQTTAQAILARVYLFLAGASVEKKAEYGLSDDKALYAQAAKWAKKVIDSGQHELSDNYSQIFINLISDQYDRVSNESMWEVEFKGNRTSPSLWSNGRIGDINGLKSQSSKYNYKEWVCNYSYGYYNGNYKLWELYRATDVVDSQKPAKDDVQTADVRQLWNLPPYNYQGSNNRKIQAVNKQTGAKEDRYITILASMARSPYFTSTSASLPADELEGYDKTINNAFDASTHSYPLDVTIAAGVRNTGKFRREVAYEGQMSGKNLFTAINFPVLRYADVLLMYAEASNEAEGSPNDLAQECVRRVRRRAGLETNAGQTGGYAEFQTLVRNERGRELAFEGLRRYDLIRWGVFVEAMHQAAAFPPASKYQNGVVNAYAASSYNNVQHKHIYLPIPTKELSANSLLKQNPLW